MFYRSYFSSVVDHSSWRYGPGGAETISDYDEHMFANCELNNEIYWAGTAYDGLPLLIIRPGLHVPGRYDDNFYLRYRL